MAEAVNCICHYCNQLGHLRRECPIRKAEVEAKGLNVDQIDEEERQRSLAKQYSRPHGNGGRGDGMVGASVEADDTKVVVVMEMVGDGVITMVLVGDGVTMITLVEMEP